MRRWLMPIAVLGAALVWLGLRRGTFERWLRNMRACSMPSASLYDRLWSGVLGGFYARVTDEVVAACPAGLALDVGSGPGHLAVRLARASPGLSVVGVDILPSMVERAGHLAAASGVADRVRFQVGDVGALSFPDAHFDVVVSTLSFHHWPDPARGLAEVYRVLKPGGTALIYDLGDWLSWVERRGAGLAGAASVSPFAAGTIEVAGWPARLPLLVRARLVRPAGG